MSFAPAGLEGQSIPHTVELDGAAAADFELGALLLVDGNGDFAECGADPASIAAVAAHHYGPVDSPDFTKFDTKEFPPGKIQAFPVANGRRFSAKYIGTLPTQVGGVFGVVKDTDSLWKVDFSETVNTRVTLLDLGPTEAPLSQGRVIVSVLAANVQVI